MVGITDLGKLMPSCTCFSRINKVFGCADYGFHEGMLLREVINKKNIMKVCLFSKEIRKGVRPQI